MLLAERVAEDRQLRGEAFNFSNEAPITVADLAHKILALMGSNLELDIRNEASNEIRFQYLSAEKARRILDWRPIFELDQGLEKTIAWYRDFLGDGRTAELVGRTIPP
jgi:CDP-glucose 4,6-dehydratase